MTQLLVSDGTAPAFTSGVLNAGAIAVLKKSSAGPTVLVAGETITDSDEIQLVQGTAAGKNIYSPWIPGRMVTGWFGNSYSAQTAQVQTLTFATNASAAGDVTVKLTCPGPGAQQYKRKSWTLSVASGATAAATATAFYTLINADLPDFLASVADNGSGVLTLTGKLFNIANGTDNFQWETQQENFGAGGIGTTCTVAQTANSFAGYGDPNYLKQFELHNQGDLSFYNRLVQPNTPASYIDVTTPTTYDVYVLAWNNPVPNQINGVDNKRVLRIAYKVNGTDQANFENRMNGWLASCPGAFNSVTL